jgi:hypothetical protein
MLTRQVLYHLRQVLFFVLGIFEIEPCFLPGLALNGDPPDLCLLSS